MPAAVEFVDIAGLVKGASEGEGLGNQFLANIREVDAIVHVVRCFEDDDIQHVMGAVDPVRDREIINIELGLADLASVEKRLDKTARAAKSGDPQAKLEARLLEPLRDALAAGRPARAVRPDRGGGARPIASFNLLTAKPVLYAANVAEDEIAAGNRSRRGAPGGARARSGDRRGGHLLRQGRGRAGRAAAGGPEPSSSSRSGSPNPGSTAWPTRPTTCSASRATSPRARRRSGPGPSTAGTRPRPRPGVIHSDFEKGFIRAETVAYDDFVRVGGWKPAREQGLARAEGKEYVVQDGDVMLFRFSS